MSEIMNRQQWYKFIFDYYYGLYLGGMMKIPYYNKNLSKEENARRRANIKAVERTETNYQNQFKEKECKSFN